MGRRKSLPSQEGVDIWVVHPKAFIFLVYRMVKKLSPAADFYDCLYFLRADFYEIGEFIETLIPPVNWLIELIKTEEGLKILDIFKLPKSHGKLLMVEQEMGEHEFYVPAESLFSEENIFLESESEKKGGEMGRRKRNGKKIDLNGEKPGKSKGDNGSGSRKLVADPKEQFLAGMQRVTGIHSGHGFNQEFGVGQITLFRKDGKIPETWKKILLEYGQDGEALLARFSSLLREEAEQPRIVPEKTRRGKKSPKPNEPVVSLPIAVEKTAQQKNGKVMDIPLGEVTGVLNEIRMAAGFQDDEPISAILGENVRDMRKGRIRLTSGHLKLIIGHVDITSEVINRWI